MCFVVIAGGPNKNLRPLLPILHDAEEIICADSGADALLPFDIVPGTVWGDMDSISPDTVAWLKEKNVSHKLFPVEKDMTDSELCLTSVPKDKKLLFVTSLMGRPDHVIHVISDEPYIDLAYDGMTVPSSLASFDNLIVCFSWSKSLSLPGERIGYTCVSPKHEDFALLTAALVLCNRILGAVNAPALMQRVVAKALNAKVDVPNYERRRNLLYNIITEAGFTCTKPQGALYLFMKTPIEDNKFCEVCAKYNVLVVPGSAFKREGYARLAFCVSEKTILGSKDAFEAIAKELGLKA